MDGQKDGRTVRGHTLAHTVLPSPSPSYIIAFLYKKKSKRHNICQRKRLNWGQFFTSSAAFFFLKRPVKGKQVFLIRFLFFFGFFLLGFLKS